MRKLPAAFAVLALLVATACSGVRARNQALLPVMGIAYSSIAADVEMGLAIGLREKKISALEADLVRDESAKIRDALSSGDRVQLLGRDWQLMERHALYGINERLKAFRDGELAQMLNGKQVAIGIGVAGSLMERISKFTSAWQKAVSR